VESPEGSGRYPGKYTSIALDADGNPHISYFNITQSSLMYAYKDGSGWHTETVDNNGSVGTYTSLELDDAGYPHISYRDSGGDVLKYAIKDAGGWAIHTVDNSADVGEYTSLALDGAGDAHISYYDLTNDTLKYAFCEYTGPTPTATSFWRHLYLPLTRRA